MPLLEILSETLFEPVVCEAACVIVREVSVVLLLSAVIPSPVAFASLVGIYIITRSWFSRGFLTPTTSSTGGGGSRLSVGGSGSSSSSPNDGYAADGRRLRSSGGGGSITILRSIKLTPLGNDVSALLDSVMNGNRHIDVRGAASQVDAEDDDESLTSNIYSDMEESYEQAPKKQYRKNDNLPKASENQGAKMEEVDYDSNNMDIDGSNGDDECCSIINGGAAEDATSLNNNCISESNGEETKKNAIEQFVESSLSKYSLDCYPYSFSPLLLFTKEGYFDRGYSNYNAVAAFFVPALKGLGGGGMTVDGSPDNGRKRGGNDLGRAAIRTPTPSTPRRDERQSKRNDSNDKTPHSKEIRTNTAIADAAATADDDDDYYEDGIDMLHGVLYDRKNLTYDELFNHIVSNQSIVTCCIDAHFTGFQMLSKNTLLYYDPLSPSLRVCKGDQDVHKVALYLLMKCHYGDNAHVQENEKYYTSPTSTSLQKAVHNMWKKINTLGSLNALQVRWMNVPLTLSRYLFINDKNSMVNMTVQLTGNTCYFQTYLFALLCKVGRPYLSPDGRSVTLHDPDLLEKATIRIAQFLLTFFVDQESRITRPYTNSNFILDFNKYRHSPYYLQFKRYLEYKKIKPPDYDKQYEGIAALYAFSKNLHSYDKFVLEGATSSTPNSKSLQFLQSTEGASMKLGRGDYYKYRAVNLMFGCNAAAMIGLCSFSEFNAWRKNQLLAFYNDIKDGIDGLAEKISRSKLSKYRDYYFMPQFEVGQQELIDIHHYTYLIDMVAMGKAVGVFPQVVHEVNSRLVNDIHYSTQNRNTYHKMVPIQQLMSNRKFMNAFQENFLSVDWFMEYIGLGFSDINPKEKEINSLTQTVFYQIDMMRHQGYRQEYEFEKECINQMARSNVRRFEIMFQAQNSTEKYEASIKIGYGFTYSKYNTLMHFLNVAGCYWVNPDVNNIQLFGKDVRSLLSISCQKIFFDTNHCGCYYYGPVEQRDTYRVELDLAVANGSGKASPSVSASKYKSGNCITVVDRVYEFSYLKGILLKLFQGANNTRIKSDNTVLNLLLLSLQLDFGLFDQYASLLNIAFMKDLHHEANTRELQVEIANLIYDFDRKHSADSITRSKVEELIFEVSYNFLINKDFDINSAQFKLISMLNADSDYQEYVLLVKIYMSLCSINKSVEVDYYKIKVNGSFNIIIPFNFSKTTSEYLEEITKHHSFSENDGIMMYDDIHVFDLNPQQPEINLYRIRLEPSTPEVQSMVKYIEFTNVFQALVKEEQYLIFIADNVILIDVLEDGKMSIRINKVDAKVATIYFNEAISFIPCFKYTEGEDIIIFTSPNIHNLVDSGGQFCPDYYGMKHELIECITSEELYIDLNDDPKFRCNKLSELLSESKVVVYFPDYMLLVSSRQQLINLLDYAIKIRNIGFFILVLTFLRRVSIKVGYLEKNEGKVVQITGPWKEAILYVIGRANDDNYDAIFEKQFVDIDRHANLPLRDFIEVLSENFKRYQRHVDGEYQIIPREKQKLFLEHIIRGEECFHFSEVGSGKTKVIMPLLCQIFLSNNKEAHKCLARGGKQKDTLVILVPEHLLPDARTQVFRHCLNLNFHQSYRIFDDILTLLNENVCLGDQENMPKKKIFVTSFNQFKKALTYDKICKKIRPHRDHILIVADEVDDFLDRDKLVFNICCNKANSFERNILEYFYEVSHAAYHGREYQSNCYESSPNPEYWKELYSKFLAIHNEIQDASKSLNKSFGIFNEKTLRHCSTSISHDIEGYKALIARPYESVNRAMPGSYYSDVERTIFLTYVILSEDIAKYDELFQGERKFIMFEYWKENLAELDFDELVYGHSSLSEIVEKHPNMLSGLIRFLYVIILKRMEVRDRSKSVNSIDIIFNFDCIGFTGTPFLDNYPTSDYIRHRREDDIPPCIDRSFYAYTSENLQTDEFEQRFARFQGQNNNVNLEYVSSDFMQESLKVGEMETLDAIFKREETEALTNISPFNVIVDLCGIFKLSSIDDVRMLILNHFGPDCFHYIYHIDQSDGSDRMLCIKSKNDVTFDEEFYKFLCRTYGATLREKVFFFIDNRNYIGKDVPYQLVFQKQYKMPLFVKSVVIAHDVEDFSKIWQAMGRSRTMNETTFSIYKNRIPPGLVDENHGLGDIKKQPLTKLLYTHNCDSKMAGNLSSIYQTLIALYNLSQQSFYYSDEIVNTFIEKMEKTIVAKVKHLEGKLASVLGSPTKLGQWGKIVEHIFRDKFRRCSINTVARNKMSVSMVDTLVRQIVRQKFEQRLPSGDVYDDYIRFLSGEQQSLMEISYTKQQQKQKQKQKAKSQDNDTMDVFDKQNQMYFVPEKTPNYYDATINHEQDSTKATLSLPFSIPIFSMQYSIGGTTNVINVYPTIQFLYSHHIMPRYITEEVQILSKNVSGQTKTQFCTDFVASVTKNIKEEMRNSNTTDSSSSGYHANIKYNAIRQNPQFSLVGIQRGVYIVGMKDQFNIHDRDTHPLSSKLQYAVDEMGFVLFDKTNTKSVDDFGPYCIEQYVLLDALSKQEVAQNVITYYCNHKEKLEECLRLYDEKQGKGFICWRFLMHQIATEVVADAAMSNDAIDNNNGSGDNDDDNALCISETL